MSTLPALRSDRPHVLEIVGNAIVGGMEMYVARLIERLSPARFRVSVLCPSESPYADRLRQLGAEVFTTPMPDDASWSSIQLACALIRSRSVDVVHTHLSNAHLLGGLAGRLCGKQVLATVHGRQLTALDIEVHLAAGTELHVVCRQSYFHACGIGVDPAHLHFIPNGVDTTAFAPAAHPATAAQRRFKLAKDAQLVGFVGRLSPEKGPEVFLRMALAVHQASPRTRFVVVGDGPMLPALKAFVAQSGLAGVLDFAGLQHEMPALLHELDVLVSTSHSEAMPLALMEAMACAIPIVATRVGGVPDLVQHGVTGWLAPAGDHDGLAAHVLGLLRDGAVRAAAGEAARRRAVASFSLDVAIEETSRLLARLARDGAPGKIEFPGAARSPNARDPEEPRAHGTIPSSNGVHPPIGN